MTNVWCVRAEFGTYTEHFLKGGYVAIGWIKGTDLSNIKTREALYPLYKAEHPDDTSNIVIGQQVGQIARFLLEIQAGDYVITPAADTELLHYGQVAPDPSYFYGSAQDGCPYLHRRRVTWAPQPLKRYGFSVPFQNTMRASLTVFAVSQRDEFLAAVGREDLVAPAVPKAYDPYRVVLEQVLQLDDKEFEILVGHLLTALGFEASEVTGKTGDGGVDATGELNVANLAKVKVFVQAKRYQLGAKVSANVVKLLRQAIPFGGQGAFITTAGFQNAAADVAIEPGFPRIGLINGRQLVDLLVEHWNDIPQEFQERLGLKPGLVRT
jgi:restriction system protein